VKLTEIVEEIKEAAEYILNMAAKLGARYCCRHQHIFVSAQFSLSLIHKYCSRIHSRTSPSFYYGCFQLRPSQGSNFRHLGGQYPSLLLPLALPLFLHHLATKSLHLFLSSLSSSSPLTKFFLLCDIIPNLLSTS
jgi:hypothetical protein